MNILINALSARLGGGQTYVKKLLEYVPDDFPGSIYVLAPENLDFSNSNLSVIKLNTSKSIINSIILRTLWEYLILPVILRKMNINILFCPGGLINSKIPPKCKTVVTFQNMLPFDTAQIKKYGFGYSWIRNTLLRIKLLQSMEKADLVIFISQYARQFVESSVKQPLKNIVVICHGIDSNFFAEKEKLPPLPEWFQDEKYILYVSSIDVYKSQCEVIEAYQILKTKVGKLPKLLFVGHQFSGYTKYVKKLIEKYELGSHIKLINHVDYSILPAIYQNAILNIFMSQTENCPFILLEAMASGIPLVVSNVQPMPELAGDNVLYCKPDNPDEIAKQIEIFLKNKELRIEYGNKAMNRALLYKWEDSAVETWRSIFSLA